MCKYMDCEIQRQSTGKDGILSDAKAIQERIKELKQDYSKHQLAVMVAELEYNDEEKSIDKHLDKNREVIKFLNNAKEDELATILDWFATHSNPRLFPQKIHPFQIGYGDTILGEPTHHEKTEMAKRAKRTGLKSGYYEGWQLVQIFEWKDSLWQEIISEMNTAYAINDQLAAYLADICGYVRRVAKHRKLYTEDENGKRVYPVTEQDAGNIMKSLTETYIRIERMLDSGWKIGLKNYNVDPETVAEQRAIIEMDGKETYSNVISLVDGIRKLINGKDEGESLRDAVEEIAIGLPEIRSWLVNATKFGAPGKPAIELLCERIHDWKTEDKMKWTTMIKHLETMYQDDTSDLSNMERKQIDEWWHSYNGVEGNMKTNYYRWKKKNRH